MIINLIQSIIRIIWPTINFVLLVFSFCLTTTVGIVHVGLAIETFIDGDVMLGIFILLFAIIILMLASGILIHIKGNYKINIKEKLWKKK